MPRNRRRNRTSNNFSESSSSSTPSSSLEAITSSFPEPDTPIDDAYSPEELVRLLMAKMNRLHESVECMTALMDRLNLRLDYLTSFLKMKIREETEDDWIEFQGRGISHS